MSGTSVPRASSPSGAMLGRHDPGLLSRLAVAADVMVVMLVLGIIGGMAWGAIPAFLKNRFSANEILTSPDAGLCGAVSASTGWCAVPGAIRRASTFPKTVNFEGWQLLPTLGGDIHLGALFALIAAHRRWPFVMGAHAQGLRDCGCWAARRGPGASPASRAERAVLFCFLLSGGLAGPCRRQRRHGHGRASCSRHIRRATASPPSSSPSSAGSIRSA